MNIGKAVDRLRKSIYGRSKAEKKAVAAGKLHEKFEDDAYAMDRYSRQIGTYGVSSVDPTGDAPGICSMAISAGFIIVQLCLIISKNPRPS